MSGKKQPLNGSRGSRLSKKTSHDSKKAPLELERLLVYVYRHYQKLDDAKADALARRDFVFHMTDWLEDFHRLNTVYTCPNAVDKKTAGDWIAGFLIHALPHLRAASRLLLDYAPEDPFLELEPHSKKAMAHSNA